MIVSLLFVASSHAGLDYGPFVTSLTPTNWAASVDEGSCSLPSCKQTGGSLTMVDFFAPWCPHCQREAPIWSRAAEHYSTNPGVHFGAVDCTAHRGLCSQFGVNGYPTMCSFSSSPKGIARASGVCDSKRTGELGETALLQWVDSLPKPHPLAPQPTAQNSTASVKLTKTLVPQTQVQSADMAAAVLYGLRHGIMTSGSLQLIPGSARAAALARWLQLLQQALNPSTQLNTLAKRLLQLGGAAIGEAEWATEVDKLVLWGHESVVKYSVCVGKHHGYACGLWQVFHALTVAASDSTAKSTLLGIQSYVATFFDCLPCQQHFHNASKHIALNSFNTTSSQAVRWLWTVHNQVSDRIAPDFGIAPSDALYPSEVACAQCRGAGGDGWDLGAVEAFLRETYSLQTHGNSNTWGWGRLLVAVLMVITLSAVGWYAMRRFFRPPLIPTSDDSSQMQTATIDNSKAATDVKFTQLTTSDSV